MVNDDAQRCPVHQWSAACLARSRAHAAIYTAQLKTARPALPTAQPAQSSQVPCASSKDHAHHATADSFNMYVYIYVYLYTYVYIYIQIHTLHYTYIHTYIYTHKYIQKHISDTHTHIHASFVCLSVTSAGNRLYS